MCEANVTQEIAGGHLYNTPFWFSLICCCLIFTTCLLRRQLSTHTFHKCCERRPYLNWRIFLQIMNTFYSHNLLVWPRSGKFATPSGHHDSAGFANKEKLGNGG